MAIFSKKKENIITDFVVKEVEGAEVYIVSWDARYGNFNSDYKTVAKAFLNLKDAETFVKSLEEAANLLQYTENLNITIEKQK